MQTYSSFYALVDNNWNSFDAPFTPLDYDIEMFNAKKIMQLIRKKNLWSHNKAIFYFHPVLYRNQIRDSKKSEKTEQNRTEQILSKS